MLLLWCSWNAVLYSVSANDHFKPRFNFWNKSFFFILYLPTFGINLYLPTFTFFYYFIYSFNFRFTCSIYPHVVPVISKYFIYRWQNYFRTHGQWVRSFVNSYTTYKVYQSFVLYLHWLQLVSNGKFYCFIYTNS